MWLYKATGDVQYLNEAKKWFDPAPDWGMSWDDKVVACQVSHRSPCRYSLLFSCFMYHLSETLVVV
jgi:hypothetical protein